MHPCLYKRLKRTHTSGTCVALLFAITTAHGEFDASSLAAADLDDAEIGSVMIINRNIFDLENPEEDKSLYRFANAVHVQTRADVIASQLLFTSGEPYAPQKLRESERLLRNNRYLGEARIVPVKIEDGVVDLEVRTTDDWTLKPSISFGRGGGANSGKIGIEEYNLFGRGSHLGLELKSDVDRDSTTLHFSDKNLFKSRNVIALDYANNSDGFWRRLNLGRPFFALDSRHAGGVSLSSGRRNETFYELGAPVAEFEHSFSHHEAFYGWSKGLRDSWTRRWTAGVVYDQHDFGAPPDATLPVAVIPEARRFIYPFIGVEIIEDDYVEERNLDQIGQIEDRNLGANFSVRVGASDAVLHLQSRFGGSLQPSEDSTLLLDGSVVGRVENGNARDLLLSLGTRLDVRQSEKRLLHARISANVGKNLDTDHSIYLGGDNGLRGYPLRYQAGDKSMLFTLEQRMFTDWHVFRLFRVGAAVFFDAGRTWGASPVEAENLGWLRDVGLGLRIGNSRSSVGRVIHIDLAFPLDGPSDLSSWQLQIEAKRSF